MSISPMIGPLRASITLNRPPLCHDGGAAFELTVRECAGELTMDHYVLQG